MSSLSFYHHILFHTFIREKRILFFRIIFFYLQLTGFQLFQSRKCTLQVADYYIAVWILLKIEKRLIWTFQNISRLTARCESFQAWLVLSKIVRYSINPKRSNKNNQILAFHKYQLETSKQQLNTCHVMFFYRVKFKGTFLWLKSFEQYWAIDISTNSIAQVCFVLKLPCRENSYSSYIFTSSTRWQ